MGMPTQTTIIGTASHIWFPDWMQTPFSVGIGLTTNTTGVNGTAIVEYSFNNINYNTGTAALPTGDPLATSTPTWFPLVALAAVGATANFTTPCQMIRVNIVTATATSSWTVQFVQATFGR